MIRNILRYGLIVIILLSNWMVNAQSGSKAELTAFFVKPELEAHVGELVFNVLRLKNNSDEAIRIKPVLNLPEGFGLYTTAFHDTLIPANDSIMLPFRIRTSKKVDALKRYKVSFVAFDMNNKPLIEQIMHIKPQIVHNWDVEIPTNKVIFYPRKNAALFEVIVKNKGNTSELIALEIQSDNELQLTSPDGRTLLPQQDVLIGPNRDTVIKFRAQYQSEEERVFDMRKVHVNAFSGDKKIYRAVAIERYSDEYNPFFADYTLPNTIEGGIRTNDFAKDVNPYISARGFSKYKNESSLQYYFSNYNLRETSKFIEYSNYRFLYNWKGISAGIGAFGSQLGRNIYSRNAIMVGYSGNVSPESKIDAYASQDFVDPITSGAVGYNFNNDKYKAFASVSYNHDGLRKINTATILAGAPIVPLYKENYIAVMANAYREEHYQYNRYVLQGVAWDIRYLGRIGSKFYMQIGNSYGSPNIPGNQMGLLGFNGRFTFKTNSSFNYFSSKVYDVRRNYHDYTYLGEKLPEVSLHDSYANILFNSNQNPQFTYSIGPSFENYESNRPMLSNGDYETYKITKYLVEMRSVVFKGVHLDVSAGIRNIQYDGYNIINTTKPDIHIIADYSQNGYGIRINYNYGPLVTRGLYQFATDIDYNGVIVSPYIMRSYGHGRVNLQLYTNFTYRFDMNYTFANISPLAEIYLLRNWYLKLRGTYTYYQQVTDEYKVHNSVYYAEIGLKKKFGRSDLHSKERNQRRLKVICFKDENNNGRKDKLEEGIELIRLRLKQIDDTPKSQFESLPIDISLLTNDKGSVIFNRIPRGFYELDVDPLGNMQEYFYVSKEHEYVELIKNTTYFIPFQKANKIVGRINIEKTKYSGEKPLDLENIKVTAYNQAGNSFSSFTLKDGSFTLYAPGDTTYYIRLNDVFGKKYRIVENDILKKVPDPNDVPVVFNVIEKTRKINFKQAKPKKSGSESLKIKVLDGKIYENTDERIQKDAEPDFDMSGGNTSYEKELILGKHYVILAKTNTREEAKEKVLSSMLKGQDAYFGLDPKTGKYFVFSGEYNSGFDAQSAMSSIEDAGIDVIETLFYK